MSLIEVVRSRFLDAITNSAPGQWKVLVVDEHAKRLLGANLKEADILSERVTAIDLITSFRAPEPNMDAIYLLMPTTQNIDRIIRDFTDKQTYAGAWLHFTDRITEKQLLRLGQSPANPYLQKISDMYINFWALEAQTFSLYAPSHFFSMYTPPRTPSIQRSARDRLEDDLRFAARCIANVCIQMNENPLIRYYLPYHQPAVGPLSVPHHGKAGSPTEATGGRWREALGVGSRIDTSNDDHLCKVLAFMVQEELDMYQKVNPTWPDNDAANPRGNRPQGVLIITDRTMDMISPFVHEFTYQAMANDLLPVTNGVKFRYEYQNSAGVTQTQTATLSEADTLWLQTRHLHIKDTIDKIIGNLKEFQEANGVFSKSGTTSIEDVKDMLAGLGQYQEGQQQFSLHYNMAKQCMDLFVNPQRKLASMANVEQNCATGLTAEGKTPRTLVEEMVPLLADSGVDNLDKVRVIALYIIFRDGVPDEDRRRLYEHSKLSRQERAAIDNLVHMHIRVTRGAGERDGRKLLKNRSVETDYDLSRYRPLLKSVLEDMFSGKLDASVFPYVKDPLRAGPASPTVATAPTPAVTSLRNKPVWTQGRQKVAAGGAVRSENRQRVLVFVAGGMTYSEVRSVYELSNSAGKDVYIGSTHTIIPNEFVGDLQTLDQGGQGSSSLPTGLPESTSSQPRPFQYYYDQRYITKDDPPPAPKPAAALAPPGKSNGGLPSRPSLSPGDSRNSARSPSPSPMGGSGDDKKSADKSKKKRFLGF